MSTVKRDFYKVLSVSHEANGNEIKQTYRRLADELVLAKALPAKAVEDAVHIALAAVWQMDYLLTWNMRHMDNAVMRPHIEAVCTRMGFKAPTICTPEALYEAVRHD